MCLEWSEIKKGNAIMIDRLDMATVKMHAMHNPYFAILYSHQSLPCHLESWNLFWLCVNSELQEKAWSKELT